MRMDVEKFIFVASKCLATRKREREREEKSACRIAKLEQELAFLKAWQTDFYKEIPQKFPVVLTEDEKSILTAYQKKSKNYLEFGSGGSTFLALIHSNTNIYSVESDKNWIDYLRSWRIISSQESAKKVFFHIVNIGKTKEWGMPVDESRKDFYPTYSSDIFTLIDKKTIDTIFVDGRFRVACILAGAINCPQATILVHDYTFRNEYHVVEEFLDIKETVDTLVVLKLKKDCNIDKLNKAYESYKFLVS